MAFSPHKKRKTPRSSKHGDTQSTERSIYGEGTRNAREWRPAQKGRVLSHAHSDSVQNTVIKTAKPCERHIQRFTFLRHGTTQRFLIMRLVLPSLSNWPLPLCRPRPLPPLLPFPPLLSISLVSVSVCDLDLVCVETPWTFLRTACAAAPQQEVQSATGAFWSTNRANY